MTTTSLITYNVRDRGRKARGQDRNFDTAALARLINGPEVQEKVRLGDMLGYFGHWPRQKLGLEPQEGGIVDGKVVSIVPALRTVELQADPDGTIRHRAEFLDTNEGQIAARLYESKAGGFSSAIMPVAGTNPVLPASFHGFDYVLEPNYTTNRGHRAVLDGVSGSVEDRAEVMAMLDHAVGEYVLAASSLNGLFDSLYQQHQRALQVLEHLARENDLLVGQLAARAAGGAILDGVGVKPTMGAKVPDFDVFKGMELAQMQRLSNESAADKDSPEARFLMQRYGMGV